MTSSNDPLAIIDRIATGQATEADLDVIRRLLLGNETQSILQVGKYNINLGQAHSDIHIGDRIYQGADADAIREILRSLLEELQNSNSQTNPKTDSEAKPIQAVCQLHEGLQKYLANVLQRLQQLHSPEIRQNVIHCGRNFNYAAKVTDFELPVGPVCMRGEAFFMFSEFPAIQVTQLRQFSGQCLEWSKQQVNLEAIGQAVYNFRVPTHFCFAIAIVDHLASEIGTAIESTNPFDHRVDAVWYEIPVVYDLSQQKLYFYNKPLSFWENFKGEIVWQPLRKVIQELLMPALIL